MAAKSLMHGPSLWQGSIEGFAKWTAALASAVVLAACSAGTTETSLDDPSGGGIGAAAPLVVDPDNVIEFSAEGGSILLGGPFELTLSNPGGAALQWSASVDAPWVALSQTGGTLAAGAEAPVLVSLDVSGLAGLAPGVHETAILFDDPIGGGDTQRTVRLVWTATSAPLLTLEPIQAYLANGPVGGPFAPLSKTYVVRNIGEVNAEYAVSASPGWLSIDAPTGGVLAPGAQASIFVRIDPVAAAGFNVGLHNGEILFSNASAGQAISLPVQVSVDALPAALLVPTNNLSFAGQVGAGLPSAQGVTLRNTGGSTLTWTAGINANWMTVSPGSGTLAAGAATSITVAPNNSAQTLAAGSFNANLAIVNTTNGVGSKTLPVGLQLDAASAELETWPLETAYFSLNSNGPAVPSLKQYTLSNTGGAPLVWSASSSAPWIGLSSNGGTLAPGGQATLAVTVLSAQASSLPAGLLQGTIEVVNTTNGDGDQSLPIQVAKGSESPLSINLAEITYYSSELPFVDLVKTADKWLPQEVVGGAWNTGAAIAKDADGWITSLAPNQAAALLLARDLAGNYPAGVYTLLFDGKGTFATSFDASIIEVSPGRILVNVNPSNGGILLKLIATDPADPVRNIRFVMPGHEQTHIQEMWNPAFLEMLEPFAGLRFMDWQRINNSPVAEWSDSATTSHFTQATERGAALEYMVRLLNDAQKDGWFCIPHLATDDYVAQFATYVRDNLDPNLKVYVEFSNEVWNPMFQQAQWSQALGVALNLANTPFEAQLRYYSQRAVQVMEIWKGVFGNQSSRLVRTLAGQNVNPWTGQVIMDWQKAYEKADAYATAPYFGGSLGDPAQQNQTAALTVEQLLDACQTNMESQLVHVASNAASTTARGLILTAYEGGQHLTGYFGSENNQALTAKFLAANRDPRMGDIYLDYFEGWKNAGGQAFFHYNSVATYSKWGSWGSLEHLNSDKSIAPKYSAMTTFVATTPAWW